MAALPISGAYAEFVCLPQRELLPVPSGLDTAEAVSLILNYVTAYQMLHRSAKVRSGQRLLIHGAAGGVGTALSQLGRLAGLEMYGTCSSRGALAVPELGGIPIDYEHQDFAAEIRRLTSEGVDVVFDSIGGAHIWRSRRALRPGGRVVAYGLTGSLRRGGDWLQVVPVASLSRYRRLRAVHCWRLASPEAEAGGSLQHSMAQTSEAGMISTGFDHPVPAASRAEDQAANRRANSARGGETSA